MTAEQQQLTGYDSGIRAAEDDLIDAWLAYCRDAEGASEATLRAYRKGMDVFTGWLQESGNSGVVTPATVIQFKGHLQERYSAQTVNLRLSAVRGFYRWMVITGRLPLSPAEAVRGAKRSNSRRHKRDALSNGEVLAILETCDDSLIGVRDRAILTLMAYCALRAIEVHRANVGNLRTKDERLILEVQRKGRREPDDVVVIPRSQEEAIRAWLSGRTGIADHGEVDPLFVSLSNRTRGRRLSTRSIRGMIRERYRQVGVVGNRKTAHSLRHSAITNAIRHGGTPLQVKALAGHSAFDSTLVYFHAEARTADPVEDRICYDERITEVSCVQTSPCRTGFAPQEEAREFSCHIGFSESFQRLHERVRNLGRARADSPSGKR